MKPPGLVKGRPRETHSYFAATVHGLEDVLRAEMEQLGLQGLEPMEGGVWFEGDRADCYRANLWLRTAGRILWPVADFACRDVEELYQGARRIDWPALMEPDHTFLVKVKAGDPPFTHSHFLAMKIKDAVADRFRADTGQRPSVDTETPHHRIQAVIQDHRCYLSLDASGEPLFKRGYRVWTAQAPLKENLAAGLVLLSGWRGDRPLYDPFCGGGTLLIEAALLAGNRAPGLFRERFGFMNWPDYNAALLKRLKKEAKAAARPVGVPLWGADKDPEMIAAAKENAQRAGLEGDIQFDTAEAATFAPPPGPGTILTNPPYGHRMEEEADLTGLYKQLGDTLKQKSQGKQAWVFTLQGPLVKAVGLRAAKKTVLFNGPLECRLLQYDLY
ncbi:MAG: THUMP domain-containing protein [Deltaproteobacteria bacterium]|nr:THUMP domain-containing protein [Deltaproteobacteria bacterium]